MANDFVTLICPPGAIDGEISHGDHAYRPHRDPDDPDGPWLVRVPSEAALYFLRQGGFSMPRAARQDPPGTVRMIAPNQDSAKTYGDPDDDLCVPVPAALAAILKESHGFRFPSEPEQGETRAAKIARLQAELTELTRQEQAEGAPGTVAPSVGYRQLQPDEAPQG